MDTRNLHRVQQGYHQGKAGRVGLWGFSVLSWSQALDSNCLRKFGPVKGHVSLRINVGPTCQKENYIQLALN